MYVCAGSIIGALEYIHIHTVALYKYVDASYLFACMQGVPLRGLFVET